jgi:hypothetical protein
VELWELSARESIRDLVARYNSNGDTGRFAEVVDLFAPDAVMDIGDGRAYHGRDEIATIFTGTRDAWAKSAGVRGEPSYVRHCVTTHQIDIVDAHHARGRSYFFVLMAHGIDHWGRYVDEYAEIDGRWLFARRKVAVDRRSAP